MKTRDSGMPAAAQWESYFDPHGIFAHLELMRPQGTIVDVGCGYGTFTLALTRGGWRRVIALDIDPTSVEALKTRCLDESLSAIDVRQRDVVADGFGLLDGEADVVLLFNLLHCEDPIALLTEARRVLRPGGRVAVLHWRSDIPTPRGPDLSIRPRPETCQSWIEAVGFQIAVPPVILRPYHFGLVGRRPAPADRTDPPDR